MSRTFKTSLIMLLAGIVALCVGIIFTVTGRQQVARDTEPATATVVDYVEDTESDSEDNTENTIYFPVMSYEADGKTVESQYSQFDYDKIYEVGATVDIKYNPDDPEEFIVAADTKSFQMGTVWEIPVGAILIIAAIARIAVPVIMASRN